MSTIATTNIKHASSSLNNIVLNSDGSTTIANASGAGKILQVVSTFKDDSFSLTSTSYVDITGLSAAITPSSTSSKILILSSIGWGSTNNTFLPFQLVKVVGGTASNIAEPSDTTQSSSSTVSNCYSGLTINSSLLRMAYQFLDSPATTSEVTYKWQTKMGSGTGYINRRGASSNMPTTSSITLMEVAA